MTATTSDADERVVQNSKEDHRRPNSFCCQFHRAPYLVWCVTVKVMVSRGSISIL